MDLDQTLASRGNTHGEWNRTAGIAQALKLYFKRDYLSCSQQEALDMLATKLARILSGNPNELDHWVDAAGYLTLAAIELEKSLKEPKS